MAWIERDARTGFYKVGFRIGGRKLKKFLQTTSPSEARDAAAVVDQTLKAIKRGWTAVPPGTDIGEFLLSGGRAITQLVPAKRLKLSELFEAYFDALPKGGLEESTIEGMRIHGRHLCRILGKSFDIQTLATSDLQQYVRKRSQDPGRRGRKVTPGTIRKSLVTLRTVWKWGVENGYVTGTLPHVGLKYSKSVERPPFQTWQEIQRRINCGGLTDAEQQDLWDCLFLTLPEIDELLRHAQRNSSLPWVYPALCVAAHTGARRSEIIRSRLADVDLAAGVLTIHERKRNHRMTTTRRVPLSPFLGTVLESWISVHPGGVYTFSQESAVLRSKKVRNGPLPVTRDEAHNHFKHTFVASKWSVLRGWHIFRHSFCSNCAAKGVDQRIINAWVGHQTEDMVRRYRHLFPDQQQAAIRVVFG